MWPALLTEHSWQLVALALLLVGSGFFSGSETALFMLTRGQVHRLNGAGTSGRLLASLLRRPRRLLNTLLFGNMLANVAYAALSAAVLLSVQRAGVEAWAAGAASLVPLLGLILLGEVTPKMLAYVHCERWSLLAAAPLAIFERAFSPLLRLLEAALVSPLTQMLAPRPAGPADITADELNALVDLSAKRGIIDSDVNALLREIVQLTDLRVADIMVPRVDVIAYDIDAAPEGLMRLFRQTHLRKIPVYEGSIDHIVGVVHAKRLLLHRAASLRELVTPVIFVPESGNLEKTLIQFRVTRRQLAIAVDEYGGTAGLVTLEDVLEEIVGDIPDVHDADRGPAVERIADRRFMLDGNLAIHEWADAFDIDLSSERISTIGGFVTSRLGRIPRPGDEVSYRNLTFTVESMRRRRVGKLRLELREEAR